MSRYESDGGLSITAIAEMADERIDLAQAALAIARLECPDLEPVESLAALDALADQVRQRVQEAEDDLARLRVLTRFLHTELGFRGNLESYYDPANSCLNEVLVRGLGIPISLGLVYMEVGRRVGVLLHGINFPGHFLLRSDAAGANAAAATGGAESSSRRLLSEERRVVTLGERPQSAPAEHGEASGIFLDPCAPLELMSAADCRDLLACMTDNRVPFEERFLTPASPKQILVRMLRNFKLAYFHGGDLEKAIVACDLVLALSPAELSDLRDRGIANLKLSAFPAALADLSRYVEASHCTDPSLLGALAFLRRQVGMLH